ncbi:MAG TPA: hypothetical protein VFQ47_01745 [Nitrososphaera sp.]|nr:hypothetical protein [Nitrososphaera sp.]
MGKRDMMRYILIISLTLLILILTACSYSTDFVVVNESDQTIEVRYKIKKFPVGPPTLEGIPTKIDASQLGSRDRRKWQKVNPDQYQIDQENRTVRVNLMPHEALWVTSMFHYFGDEDPNDVASWPVEEISAKGAGGGITFTGDKSRQSFTYVSRVLYSLTYK